MRRQLTSIVCHNGSPSNRSRSYPHLTIIASMLLLAILLSECSVRPVTIPPISRNLPTVTSDLLSISVAEVDGVSVLEFHIINTSSEELTYYPGEFPMEVHVDCLDNSLERHLYSGDSSASSEASNSDGAVIPEPPPMVTLLPGEEYTSVRPSSAYAPDFLTRTCQVWFSAMVNDELLHSPVFDIELSPGTTTTTTTTTTSGTSD